MTLYKFLNNDGTPAHGGSGQWSLPAKGEDGEWCPGDWWPVEGDLVPCRNGIHLCREQDLLSWPAPALYEAEYRGKMIEEDDKIVVRKARLRRRVETWNERTARLFACDCAERVLHLTGPDPRCTEAIAVARRYANGEATDEELTAARAAAWSAARAAARDAARAAARDAARDAAWEAARDAAWAAAGKAAWDAARAAARDAARAAARDAARDAAWDAARDAARAAAGKAAWDAARAAARDAARAAARAAARDAEQQWQTARLLAYLRGEVES